MSIFFGNQAAFTPNTQNWVLDAGTTVVGQMARYYYRYGHKPPPEMVRDLRDEGARLARRIFRAEG